MWDYHVCVYIFCIIIHTSAATDDKIQEIFHHNLYLCIIFFVCVWYCHYNCMRFVHYFLSLSLTRQGIIIESIPFTFCCFSTAAAVHLYIFYSRRFSLFILIVSKSSFILYFQFKAMDATKHPTIAIIIDDVHTDLVLLCETSEQKVCVGKGFGGEYDRKWTGTREQASKQKKKKKSIHNACR